MILASEDKLLLAGSSRNPGERERGTVYAVYELLERVFGCSFAAYGKSGTDTGEWIPSMKTMEIAPFRYVKAAADLSYRTAIVQYDVWVGDPDHPAESAVHFMAGKEPVQPHSYMVRHLRGL